MGRGSKQRRMVLGSTVVKRSVVIDGHKTSLSLEDEFWAGLKTIAQEQRLGLSRLVHEIDMSRERGSLCSAIRLYVLHYYQQFQPSNDLRSL